MKKIFLIIFIFLLSFLEIYGYELKEIVEHNKIQTTGIFFDGSILLNDKPGGEYAQIGFDFIDGSIDSKMPFSIQVGVGLYKTYSTKKDDYLGIGAFLGIETDFKNSFEPYAGVSLIVDCTKNADTDNFNSLFGGINIRGGIRWFFSNHSKLQIYGGWLGLLNNGGNYISGFIIGISLTVLFI